MCGIFGFVGRRKAADAVDLNAAMMTLSHRGLTHRLLSSLGDVVRQWGLRA